MWFTAYQFELKYTVVFLYAHANCPSFSFLKVVRNKNLCLFWFVGGRVETVCGLVLVSEAIPGIFRHKNGKLVISTNATK